MSARPQPGKLAQSKIGLFEKLISQQAEKEASSRIDRTRHPKPERGQPGEKIKALTNQWVESALKTGRQANGTLVVNHKRVVSAPAACSDQSSQSSKTLTELDTSYMSTITDSTQIKDYTIIDDFSQYNTSANVSPISSCSETDYSRHESDISFAKSETPRHKISFRQNKFSKPLMKSQMSQSYQDTSDSDESLVAVPVKRRHPVNRSNTLPTQKIGKSPITKSEEAPAKVRSPVPVVRPKECSNSLGIISKEANLTASEEIFSQTPLQSNAQITLKTTDEILEMQHALVSSFNLIKKTCSFTFKGKTEKVANDHPGTYKQFQEEFESLVNSSIENEKKDFPEPDMERVRDESFSEHCEVEEIVQSTSVRSNEEETQVTESATVSDENSSDHYGAVGDSRKRTLVNTDKDGIEKGERSSTVISVQEYPTYVSTRSQPKAVMRKKSKSLLQSNLHRRASMAPEDLFYDVSFSDCSDKDSLYITSPMYKDSDFSDFEYTNEFPQYCSSDSEVEKPRSKSIIDDVPLYQKVMDTEIESSSSEKDSEVDKKEQIIERLCSQDTPSALQRLLWCQLPEVMNSGILERMTDQERKLQEAMYEILTSEGSYQKSLMIVVNYFINFVQKSNQISAYECRKLFLNIKKIAEVSASFLDALVKRQGDNILMVDFFDIIEEYTKKHFEKIYVYYLSNAVLQNSILLQLQENNTRFNATISIIEKEAKCNQMSLRSFLLLPMQRITRLPLLIDAVVQRCKPGTALHTHAQSAFQVVSALTNTCNEESIKFEDLERLNQLHTKLVFPRKLSVSIVSKERRLIKEGEINCLLKRKGIFSSTKAEKHYFFLFNDYMLIAKKIDVNKIHVLEKCDLFEIIEDQLKMEKYNNGFKPMKERELLLLILKNPQLKTVVGSQLLLWMEDKAAKARWLNSFKNCGDLLSLSEGSEATDYPQVQTTQSYIAKQPDEITLYQGEIVRLLRPSVGSWAFGERTRDGRKGWFPEAFSKPVKSRSLRERNILQQDRLRRAGSLAPVKYIPK